MSYSDIWNANDPWPLTLMRNLKRNKLLHNDNEISRVCHIHSPYKGPRRQSPPLLQMPCQPLPAAHWELVPCIPAAEFNTASLCLLLLWWIFPPPTSPPSTMPFGAILHGDRETAGKFWVREIWADLYSNKVTLISALKGHRWKALTNRGVEKRLDSSHTPKLESKEFPDRMNRIRTWWRWRGSEGDKSQE